MFIYLPPFLFLPHSYVLYEMKIKLGHNAHIKMSIHLRKGNLSELYVGINNIYKFTLPEAVCLLLFTLVIFVLVKSYHGDVSVPSFDHCYRIQHEQVIGINNIYKFTLPEAVCCCSQTCNFCFGELLSLDISVPSLIVLGSSISKL